MGLLTSTVGSFPKPAELRRARRQFADDEIEAPALREVEERAVRAVLALQEEIGIDLLVDGELDRGDISKCFIAGLSHRLKNEGKRPSGSGSDPNETVEITGYLMSLLVADELHITNLAVSPSRRRSGIADSLIGHALQDARAHGATWCQLEVRVTNAPARTLYEKHGFREIGVRKGYYQDGEDAVVMGKELSI